MTQKLIGIVYNPISGKGKGYKAALELSRCITELGFNTKLCCSSKNYVESEINGFLSEVSKVAVVGGDGTLKGLLKFLAQTNTPVWMFPSGNQSLFARRFKMPRDFKQSAQYALSSGSTPHCLSIAANQFFFFMLSLGLDSVVIEQLHNSRTGSISNIAYSKAVIKNLFFHHSPIVSVSADGKQWLKDRNGFLVIANSKEYALSLEFVPEADSLRSELCARFFPYSNAFEFLNIASKVYLGGAKYLAKIPFIKAAKFEISLKHEYPIQADGEYLSSSSVSVEAVKDTLNVCNPS